MDLAKAVELINWPTEKETPPRWFANRGGATDSDQRFDLVLQALSVRANHLRRRMIRPKAGTELQGGQEAGRDPHPFRTKRAYPRTWWKTSCPG